MSEDLNRLLEEMIEAHKDHFDRLLRLNSADIKLVNAGGDHRDVMLGRETDAIARLGITLKNIR